MRQTEYASLVNSYDTLANTVQTVSHDQVKRLVGSVIDELKSALGAIVAAVWVNRPAQENSKVLEVYT
jgi:phage-related protein